MSWFSAISDRYRRLRHSRGFGVHSPFAFALITEALYPSRGYMYYLESDARLESPSPADSRRARAIYRLSLFLRDRVNSAPRIHMSPALPTAYAAAVRLAGCRLARTAAEADCLILPGDSANPSGEGNRRKLPADGSKGILTLHGHRLTIIVRRSGMADISYIIP